MADIEVMLDSIAIEWDKAEKLIKTAERARAQVVIASVNELRYAGRRMIDALRLSKQAATDPSKKDEFERYVSETLAFCTRAQHDAVDAIVLFLQKALQRYEEEFGLTLLGEKYPKIFEIRAALNQADALIISSREDRQRRQEEYQILADDHCPRLIAYYQDLISSKDVLLQLVSAQRRHERKVSRRFWITVIVSFAAALLGAAAGVSFGKIGHHFFSKDRPIATTANPQNILAAPDMAKDH